MGIGARKPSNLTADLYLFLIFSISNPPASSTTHWQTTLYSFTILCVLISSWSRRTSWTFLPSHTDIPDPGSSRHSIEIYQSSLQEKHVNQQSRQVSFRSLIAAICNSSTHPQLCRPLLFWPFLTLYFYSQILVEYSAFLLPVDLFRISNKSH